MLLTEIDEAAGDDRPGGASPRGRLRVSAPMLFSQAAMGKLAAGFALEYPEVAARSDDGGPPVDMVEEGYDLVIRVNPDADANLVGRIFLRDRMLVVAPPGLARPADGGAVAAVVRGAGESQGWRIRRRTAPHHRGRAGAVPVVAVHGARRRTGRRRRGLPAVVAGGARPGCRPAGQWGEVDAPEIALWALYPSRRLLSARVSAFLEHLRQAFPTGAPEELAALMA